MREPRVLFIYPPNQLMPIETPRPDGSLGPLYLAGALREIGIEADIIDAAVGADEDSLENTFYRTEMQPNGLARIGMSWPRIREVLEKRNYNIIGINSNFTPQTKMALEVAKIAKEINPEILVIAGGVNARSLYPRFFKNGFVDIICLTEGEKVVKEVVKRFARGEPFTGIPGTVTKELKICPAKEDTISVNLDELPIPAWDKLPFSKYEKIASPHGVDLTGGQYRYAPIMTSRGCPFRCLYCHISMEKDFGETAEAGGEIGNLRLKSVERVLKEIEILKGLGVKKLFIEDDSLLAKKARIKELFTAILNMGLKVADVNGVNLVHIYRKNKDGNLEPDEDYLTLLKSAGFDQIVFPVESGSQRVLDKYATGKLTLAKMDVVKLVRVAVKIGIICPINMMIGFPDETEEEMMLSIELAKKLIDAGAPYVTFFIPIPFPGSRLYDMAISGGHLDRNFDPDIMNWKNGVMVNTAVPRERIVELRDWAWRTVNPPEHVAKRLRESMGARWNPAAASG